MGDDLYGDIACANHMEAGRWKGRTSNLDSRAPWTK